MTISVPILYVIGYFYHRGYLEGYGINYDLFPRNIQQHLVDAFIAFMMALTKILELIENSFYKLFLLAIPFSFVGVLVVFTHKHDKKFKKALDSLVARKYFDYISMPLSMGVIGIIVPYLIISVLAFIMMIPIISFYGGMKVANDEINKFKPCIINKNNENNSCAHIYKKGKLIALGTIISATDKKMALYNGSKIIILENNDRYEIYRKHKNKS